MQLTEWLGYVISNFRVFIITRSIYKIILELGNWNASVYVSRDFEDLLTDERVEDELAAVDSEVL